MLVLTTQEKRNNTSWGGGHSNVFIPSTVEMQAQILTSAWLSEELHSSFLQSQMHSFRNISKKSVISDIWGHSLFPSTLRHLQINNFIPVLQRMKYTFSFSQTDLQEREHALFFLLENQRIIYAHQVYFLAFVQASWNDRFSNHQEAPDNYDPLKVKFPNFIIVYDMTPKFSLVTWNRLMTIVLGKTGSNLTAGMFLMKRSTLFKNIVLFVSTRKFRPLRPKILQKPMFMGQCSGRSGLQSTII